MLYDVDVAAHLLMEWWKLRQQIVVTDAAMSHISLVRTALAVAPCNPVLLHPLLPTAG